MKNNKKQIKLNLNDKGKIFDPDELCLTKPMIVNWIKDIRQNSKSKTLKMFCASTQVMVSATPDEQVIGFWKEVLSKIDELLMMNAFEVAKGNNEKWGDTLSKLYKKDVSKFE